MQALIFYDANPSVREVLRPSLESLGLELIVIESLDRLEESLAAAAEPSMLLVDLSRQPEYLPRLQAFVPKYIQEPEHCILSTVRMSDLARYLPHDIQSCFFKHVIERPFKRVDLMDFLLSLVAMILPGSVHALPSAATGQVLNSSVEQLTSSVLSADKASLAQKGLQSGQELLAREAAMPAEDVAGQTDASAAWLRSLAGSELGGAKVSGGEASDAVKEASLNEAAVSARLAQTLENRTRMREHEARRLSSRQSMQAAAGLSEFGESAASAAEQSGLGSREQGGHRMNSRLSMRPISASSERQQGETERSLRDSSFPSLRDSASREQAGHRVNSRLSMRSAPLSLEQGAGGSRQGLRPVPRVLGQVSAEKDIHGLASAPFLRPILEQDKAELASPDPSSSQQKARVNALLPSSVLSSAEVPPLSMEASALKEIERERTLPDANVGITLDISIEAMPRLSAVKLPSSAPTLLPSEMKAEPLLSGRLSLAVFLMLLSLSSRQAGHYLLELQDGNEVLRYCFESGSLLLLRVESQVERRKAIDELIEGILLGIEAEKPFRWSLSSELGEFSEEAAAQPESGRLRLSLYPLLYKACQTGRYRLSLDESWLSSTWIARPYRTPINEGVRLGMQESLLCEQLQERQSLASLKLTGEDNLSELLARLFLFDFVDRVPT